MAEEKRIQISDAEGNIYYPHSKSNIIFTNKGNTVEDELNELNKNIEVQDIKVANTDLNDYRKTGVYCFGVSYTPKNIPGGSNGWLEVFGLSGAAKQFWYRYGTLGSNDHMAWMRTYGGTTQGWGPWRKIITNLNVQAGNVTVKAVANNTTQTKVTFDTPFASTPIVTVSVQAEVPQNCSVGVTSVSTTGFTIVFHRITSSDTRVNWHAIVN